MDEGRIYVAEDFDAPLRFDLSIVVVSQAVQKPKKINNTSAPRNR
jgi:hypothetical protein